MSFPNLSHAWDKSDQPIWVGQVNGFFVPPCPVPSDVNSVPYAGQEKVVPSRPFLSRVPNAPEVNTKYALPWKEEWIVVGRD